MSFFSNLFGSKSKQNPNDKPPVYGGDGLSADSPVIINCASMEMAFSLIDKFISQQCEGDWEKGPGFSLNDPHHPEKLYKAIKVTMESGEEGAFYFDFSRPMTNTMRMLGLGDK